SYWVEAEVQWPDGRRAFASNSVVVSTIAAPQLSYPQQLAEGGISFRLAGTPLGTYVIQAATDLVNWDTSATNRVPGSGVLTITDPDAAVFSRRFYRAMKIP